VGHQDYKTAFAVLAVPAAIMLSLLAVARLVYPRPQDLAARPAQVTTQASPRGVLDLREGRRRSRDPPVSGHRHALSAWRAVSLAR
jgi:hypothetical protein